MNSMQLGYTMSSAVAKAQAKTFVPGKSKVGEAEIKSRFTSSKCGISIDKDALDQQVKEKKALKASQEEADRFYAQQALDNAKMAQFLEKECLKEKQTVERELRQYLIQSHQDKRAELRRREEQAAEDVGVPGVSSLQVFGGEDRDYPNRRRAQASQQQRWVQQQVAEKNLKKQQDQAQDRLTSERVEDVTHRAHQIEQSIREKRRQQAVDNAKFNKSLVEMKDKEKLVARRHEQSCNLEEIQNMLDSDLLTGNKSEGMYYGKRGGKGGPPPTTQAIVQEQSAQREENEVRRQVEKERQKADDMYEESRRRVALTLERSWVRQRKERAKQVGADRRAQVAESAAHRAAELEKSRHLDATTTGSILA